MNSTREIVLFDLKHYKSFPSSLTDTSDPYILSMQTFQAFTNSIIYSLEADQPDILALAQEKTLEHLYSGFPSFHDSDKFKSWVQDATLKYPQRRTAKQHQYIHILELQSQQDPPTSVVDIIVSAICELENWRDRAYNPSNLIKDPDALYFFKHKKGLKSVSFKDGKSNEFINDNDVVQHGDECGICANAFHPEINIPQKAPCGHIYCEPCFQSWLHKSWAGSPYTCPYCRACLICGSNPCNYHKLPNEPTVPAPLIEFLDSVLPDKLDVELHGIIAEKYWALRECTRSRRVLLASIRKSLEVTEEGHVLRGDALIVTKGMEQEYTHEIRRQVVTASLE